MQEFVLMQVHKGFQDVSGEGEGEFEWELASGVDVGC